jgi:hypothetical protein
MIHFIITVQGGLPPTVTIQEFATANNTKDAETIARLIRTFIPPYLQKVAMSNDAKYRNIMLKERQHTRRKAR